MDVASSAFDEANSVAPWPLEPATDAELSPSAIARIRDQANKTLRNFPRLDDASMFGDLVKPGYSPGPSLLMEDHRGIELAPDDRIASHEYRMMGLAREEDFLLVSQPRIRAFEDYSRKVFDRDGPQIIEVNRGDMRLRVPLAAACLESQSALEKLATAARETGTFNVCPYLSTGHDWLLAAEIARRSECPVQVCAPLPQLSRRVNDKLWFSHQVGAIIGRKSVPPTYGVYGPIAAAAVMRKLAHTHARLVVKLPASAGSLGNLVFESDYVRSFTLSDLKRELLRRLHLIGWQDRYPILVGVWEVAALASPSAQVWVPLVKDGPPLVEGIFGQVLAGQEQTFVGATRIDLPEKLETRFYREALAISHYFQCLGYFGRLSLDALLTGEDLRNATLHWIECNGRWGGVSIPMTATRSLPNIDKTASLMIAQRTIEDVTVPEFSTILEDVAGWLYSPEASEGAVFLEPTGPTQRNVTFSVVASTRARAEHIGKTILDKLLPEI